MKAFVVRLIALLAFTLLYFCAGRFGLSMAFLNASASPVWPPTGIALAAMLFLGYELWPAVFVGAFLVNLTTDHSIPTSAAIALGNTLEAVLGTFLANRFAGGKTAFDRAGSIFRFIFIAAIPSTILSATIGVASLAADGLVHAGNVLPVWFTWWTGDFVSDLVVAPLLIVWFSDRPLQFSLKRVLEALLLLTLAFALNFAIFAGGLGIGLRSYPLHYLGLPLLVWAAYRFRQPGAITIASIISAIAISGTFRGMGPFSVGDANASLVLLQTFIGVTTITALVLAAVTAEREELLQRERAARAEAEESNRAKDQFLAILSHELRTPLTPIVLAASLMERDRQFPHQFRDDLKMIRSNVDLEARLIDDLLDLTRVTRGKLQLDLQTVDVHASIRQAVGICTAATGRRVNLDLRAPRHLLRADPARMQQVVWNLVNNAMKFTPEAGSIGIRSANHDSTIVVDVSDTGAGIEPELLSRLFKPFEQGGAARAGNNGGLGLGLAIARNLAVAHGGQLIARSAGAGLGATFTITLPTVDLPSQGEEQPPPSALLPDMPLSPEAGIERTTSA